MTEKLIEIRGLYKSYEMKREIFGASKDRVMVLEDVSLDIYKGETLGLVGESGSGKSTLGKCILQLTDADKGEILFNDSDVCKMGKNELKTLRKKMQVIFQDPYSTLNPRMTVGAMLKEIIRFHTDMDGRDVKKRCIELMEVVGLKAVSINKYPHEFSGGQRQRIAIARALAVDPEFIVCDEPVSALDVSVQSQILNLLKDLQKEFRLTYLFISHNLAVVKFISDRIAVMQKGRIVETAEKNELFRNTKNEYTKLLIKAVPVIDFK